MKPIVRWNIALTGVLTTLVCLRLLLWPLATPACASCGPSGNRPIWCDFIEKLAVNYLNAGLSPPEAFQFGNATFIDGQAAEFQVYGLTGDPNRYANVTSEFNQNSVRVHVRAVPGSHDVSGLVVYSNSNNLNRIYYWPRHRWHQDRIALLTFDYICTCPRHVYTTTFTLKIPAGAGA